MTPSNDVPLEYPEHWLMFHIYVSVDHPRIQNEIEICKTLIARNPDNPNHRRIAIDTCATTALKNILVDAGFLPRKLNIQSHFEIKWALQASPMFEKVQAIILLAVA